MGWLRLADTTFGDEVPPDSYASFCKRLMGRVAGPVACAGIYSLIFAMSLSICAMAFPLWACCVLTAVYAAITVALYRPRKASSFSTRATATKAQGAVETQAAGPGVVATAAKPT